jgi:hypothetical protein
MGEVLLGCSGWNYVDTADKGGWTGVFYPDKSEVNTTTWKDPSHAEFLTSVTQITSAAEARKLTNNIAGLVS